MVDYNFNVPAVQPMQQPNMLAAYGQMQQIQANRMLMQDREREQIESNAIRNAIRGGVDYTTPEGQRKLLEIAPKTAPTLVKSLIAIQSEEQSAAAQKAQAEHLRAQTERVIGQLGSDKIERFRNSLATVPPDDPAAYAAWYRIAAPEFNKIGAPIPQPSAWNAKTQAGMLDTAQSVLERLKEAAKERTPKGVTLAGGQFAEHTAGAEGRPGTLEILTPTYAGSGIPQGRAGLPPEQAGVPSSPVSADRQRAMAAAGQRYAPDLVGAAPAPASPYGALGVGPAAAAAAEKVGAEAQVKEAQAKDAQRKGALEILNSTSAKDLEKLIAGSTSGGLQRKLAGIQEYVTGEATPGMVSIQQLKPVAEKLILELTNGKLGGGVSDRDVALLRGLVSDMANPDIGANARVTAFRQFRNGLTALAEGKPIEVAPTTKELRPGATARGRVDASNPLLR